MNHTFNKISNTARLHPSIVMGKYNKIGENVVIDSFKGTLEPQIIIGDNNIINDNTRILVGEGGLTIGDWNVLHNDMLVMAEDKMLIGHNCWFGQNTILDATGGLTIGNGVRVGMYSQIWTHVASGELIEGCQLFSKRATIIEDDVWLVGSCVVSSGLHLGKKSICFINSVITKNTEPNRVYSGAPAKLMERLNFWKDVSIEEKFDMLETWAHQFAQSEPNIFIKRISIKEISIANTVTSEILIIRDNYQTINNSVDLVTEFNLLDKTFKKKNTPLERLFYSYIYNHKARFIPIEC